MPDIWLPPIGLLGIIEAMHFVYAIYNRKKNKLYVGETADVERRITEHNQKRGKHFTARFEGEWVLIHAESLTTRSEALKREK